MGGITRAVAAATLFASALVATVTGGIASAPPASAAPAPPATAARTGVPANIYAIGDSITTATGTDNLGAEVPANSWVTGTNSSVQSMRARLGIQAAQNLANNGKRMQDFDDQAVRLPPTAQYVVVEMGGNDLCRPSVGEMTSVADYRAQFRAGLQAVAGRAPEALIFVASIPDIYNLWYLRGAPSSINPYVADQTGQAGQARFYWGTLGVIPCQSLLDDPESTSSAAVNRRLAVRTRNLAFNDVLEQECAAVLRCRYDGDAFFDKSSNRVSPPNGPLLARGAWWFEDDDISHNTGGWAWACPAPGILSGGTICGDHFHPSLRGQGKLAQAGHEASYQFLTDATAPTATATPARAPDGGGVYAHAVEVGFGGTDASGLRGQEVRIQQPDGTLGGWQQHLGVAPPVTVSAVGTTYVQVRSLDVNGNLSASTTLEVTIAPEQFGAVAGTVTGPSGPLTGIEVTLHAAGAEGALASDTTEADGTYAFPERLASTDYKVRAVDPSGVHVTEWYDGAATHAAATAVDVPGGGTATADLALALTPGSVTGTVSGPAGPVAGLSVTATTEGTEAAGEAVTTDADGHYEIVGLGPGAHTVTVAPVACTWAGASEAVEVPTGGAAATVDLTVADAAPAPHGLSDVPAELDAAVSWLIDACNTPRYLTAYRDGTFRAGTVITRGQAVRSLWIIAGRPAVSRPHGLTGVSAALAPAVRWAVASGHLAGLTDGRFGAGTAITRGDLARFVHRLAAPGPTAAAHGLIDVPRRLEQAVRWLVAEGVAAPTGARFRPSAPARRGLYASWSHLLAR